jgi:hypothetical protein
MYRETSDTLYAGDTARFELAGLTNQTHSVWVDGNKDTSTSTPEAGPDPHNITIDYDAVTTTQDPGVDVTGDGSVDVAYSGTLEDGESQVVDAAIPLSTGEHNLTWQTAAGDAGYMLNITEQTTTEGVTVSTAGSDESVSTGKLQPGETVTREFDHLSAGSNEIQASINRSKAGYQFRYAPRSIPQDVTVTDASGSSLIDHSGKLDDTTTRRLPIDSSRSLSVDAAASGGLLNTTIAFRETNETENVDIDTAGDGDPEIETGPIEPGTTRTYTTVVNRSTAHLLGTGPYSYGLNYTASEKPQNVNLSVGNDTETLRSESLSGPIQEPRTLSVDGVSPGELSITASAAHGSYQLNATWGKQIGAKSPNVTIGDWAGCSIDGMLDGTETCYVPDGTLNASTNTVDFDTEAGSINYTFTMDARAVAEEVSVTSNDATITYPTQMDRTGLLPPAYTPNTTKNVTTFEGGDNTIQVQTEAANGIETTATARVQYEGETAWTKEPTITVVNADGIKSERSLDSELNTAGELRENTTVSIPPEWLTEGSNSIQITAADGTKVTATVEASGAEAQKESFAG